MPDFTTFTPVTVTNSDNSPTTITFSGPFDQILQNLQTSAPVASATQEESSGSDSQGFKWRSGGLKEQEYTQPRYVAYQQQSQAQTAPPQQQQQTTNAPVSDKAAFAVKWALSKVGRPYVWGAKGQNDTFDCSGLAYAAYKAAGIKVPGSTSAWLSSNKQTVGKYDGQPGDVIITGSRNSPSGRHARIITENLGNGKYACVEAKGKKYGVVTSTYTVGSDLKNIYRAKLGAKLIKKHRYEQFK